MRYVTYDPATGALTGCYLQDVLPEHAECFIEIPEEQANVWVALQANDDRTGVEEAPPKVPEPPTPEEVQAGFLVEVQRRLDAFAQARGYDGIVSLCSYLPDDPNPRYASDGARGRLARSTCWTSGTELIAAIAAGDKPMPTSKEEAIAAAGIPDLVWPEEAP